MTSRSEYQSLAQLASAIRSRKISSEELVSEALKRIDKHNPRLTAFIQVRGKEALREARELDRRLAQGEVPGPLCGIPMSLKDLIETRCLPTTAGSRVFGNGLSSRFDATLVRRLLSAGAILIGKTNLHEFAYGVTTENAHFGPARNPWDPERIAGGSSGGSGVAVARQMGFFSIGTDTRGSIRIPSAFCGITGFKGTLGSVPTRGVLPLSWTLDHAGPMTRSVEDAETVFNVIRNPSGQRTASRELLRIGICQFFLERIDNQIRENVLRAIEHLQTLGHAVLEVQIPLLEESVEVSRILAASEAAAYHEQFINTRKEGYDPAVRDRLLIGFSIPAHKYVQALQLRDRFRAALRKVFRQVDCLAGATVPSLPRRIGANVAEIDKRLTEVGNIVRLNAPQNVAGVPALALPCGFAEGLPISLQLIAPWHHEERLFALGKQYQSTTEWHLRQPLG